MLTDFSNYIHLFLFFKLFHSIYIINLFSERGTKGERETAKCETSIDCLSYPPPTRNRAHAPGLPKVTQLVFGRARI